MESESYDWRDVVVQQICSAPIDPDLTSPYAREAFAVYTAHPARAIERYHRSVWQRKHVAMPALIATTGIGGSGFLAALSFACVVHATATDYQRGLIALGIGIISLLAAAVITVMIDRASVANEAVDILVRHPEYYLPSVEYQTVDGDVCVSLADTQQTYTSRIFDPNDETRALEYQVELEAIVESVRTKRQMQYAQASSVVQPLLDQTAHEQLLLPIAPEDEGEDRAEALQKLLKSQRQANVAIST